MLNRRSFLKLSGAVLTGAALPQTTSVRAAGERPIEDRLADAFVPTRRGRVLTSSVAIWDQIETPHAIVKRIVRDEVILLGEEKIVPGTGSAYNNLWYRTRGGWVHSAWIQPMEFHDRPAMFRQAGSNGFWVEVIVPKTATREEPSRTAASKYEYVYGTVYLVTEVRSDAADTL